MEKKLILALDGYEQRILIRALNDLRTQLIREERPTDPVDELIMKVYETRPKHFLVAEGSIAHEYREEGHPDLFSCRNNSCGMDRASDRAVLAGKSL